MIGINVQTISAKIVDFIKIPVVVKKLQELKGNKLKNDKFKNN